MPTIYIDNKAYEVKAGKNLLEASLAQGLNLPYFCWHPALGSVGACRQCAVKIYKDENDKQGRLIMSCMEGVRDGLRISIDDKTAKSFREQVIEWLMTNHPHDCPVCDEGGSCHLQDMTVMTGHDYRRYDYKKRTYRNQYLGPLIHHEMNRCIQCYRCVRYYHDYAGGDDLNVFAAHNHVYFGREKDGILESPFSGNLAEVCPTGVFTDKTLKEHYTRKWDLTMAPSVCQHCSVGCNIIAGERYGEIRCVLNRYNGEVNGYFLCDRGRFGYEFVNSENRIRQPLIRNKVSEAVTEAELINELTALASSQKMIGIGSPRASLETNFALMQLVGQENFYEGINENEAYLTKKIIDHLQSGTEHSASLKEIEQADAILILGEDIWNTAPMMALAVRQSVMKTAQMEASTQAHLPIWLDAAVKELVQEKKGFLANLTIDNSTLDDIAEVKLRAAPDNLARLGFAIAHELNPALASMDLGDDALSSMASSISKVLAKASKPVVITGISSYNEAIVKAAFHIAMACNGKISFVLPECNSMGLSMLKGHSIEKAVERIRREQGVTVFIVENDLYRNVHPALADSLFEKARNVVVFDSLHNATTEKANILIPAATFAEADGTIVNQEGRAQRYFQVYAPSNAYIKETWKWLSKIQQQKIKTGNGYDHNPDQLLEQIEKTLPQFKGITSVAPPHNFNIHGERIPREPHRYSGRTAMLANLSVSEPKPLHDNDSPLTFTMEGYKGIPPSSATPFYWAPGWNSVQSLTKYQQEPGGPLHGGDPGVRLFTDKSGVTPTYFKDVPVAFMPRKNKWLLLPQYHVLGSGEFSVYTKGLAELSPDPYLVMASDDALQMGIENNTMVSLHADERTYSLPVQIKNNLPRGLMMVSAGLQGMPALNWGSWAQIERIPEKV